MSGESQEISVEVQQEKPLPEPVKKPKRIMSEAQKQNLVKAREKALLLRNQLKEKKLVPAKKLSKLEKELQDIKKEQQEEQQEEQTARVARQQEDIPPLPPPPTKQEVVKEEPYKPQLVKRDDGFFYLV